MARYLTDSSNTGRKIIMYWSDFKFSYDKCEDKCYKFLWHFNGQHGYISIRVKNSKVSNSSLIDTDSDSPNKFGRPLGLYNDNSLFDVFKKMMESINISVLGVYREF